MTPLLDFTSLPGQGRTPGRPAGGDVRLLAFGMTLQTRLVPSKYLASISLAPVLLGLTLASCLGGASSGSSPASAFGVTVCSLGCGGSSFAVTTWQANKDIQFTFSDEVDPFSVNFSSISILEAANGSAPLGSFVVSGTRVTFRPALIENSGGLTFGFTDGRTYRIEIPSKGPNVVRSRRGRMNTNELSGTIFIDGIADLVPGPPTIASYQPNADNPPTTNDFQIKIVFSDILRTSQLADPQTGASALVTVSVADAQTGSTSVVPGTFAASIDRDALTTRLVFTPLVGYPSGDAGRRQIQVNLSQQITDLVGNPLSGAGILVIPLPDGGSKAGTLTESFNDNAREDAAGSTDGLWAGVAGALDSGQDALTGRHRGGGSGVLGKLVLSGQQIQYDTDSFAVFSDFLNETVTVTGGVFPYEQVDMSSGTNISGVGANALRIWSRGDMILGATINLDGEDAPPNYGKCLPEKERNVPEPTTNTFIDEFDPIRDLIALGGDPGVGGLSGGSGGHGGMSWYGGASGMGFEFGSNQYYYDTQNCGWRQIEDGSCTQVVTGRFRDTYLADAYCGANGDRVGGVVAQGAPVSVGRAKRIDDDLDAGSGMGSWAWPPKSNVMPLPDLSGGSRVKSHVYIDNGTPISRENHTRHRSRGGGGGGYWTAGKRGEYFVSGSIDPLGVAIGAATSPIVNVAQNIREYNDDGTGVDYITWDSKAGVESRPVFDAEGGDYVKPVGMETLDPELGFLLGGAGGGGSGNNQHGSWKETPTLAAGDIDTFRCGDGAGGGAGGGAAQFMAGGRLSLTGSIRARGGDGGDSEFMLAVPYVETNHILYGTPGDSGGDGGAGGAVLLQSTGPFSARAGSVRGGGGTGGIGSAGDPGGDGGSGVVRVDAPTPLTLAALQNIVEPDESVDLTPVGLPGQPNSGSFSASWSGASGDVTAGDGTVFNGNASGVRSRWYEAPADVNQFVITRWEIECSYLDGAGVHSLVFDSDTNPTDPGVTPIWVAFQAAWMQVGESQKTNPDLVLSTDWVIPGYEIVTNGLDQLSLVLARAVRFTLVFDQDLVNALIGGTAGGYFRVTRIQFEWEGS